MVCMWNNRVKQHHLHYPTRHKSGISISRIFKTSLHLYFLTSNLVFCLLTVSLTFYFQFYLSFSCQVLVPLSSRPLIGVNFQTTYQILQKLLLRLIFIISNIQFEMPTSMYCVRYLKTNVSGVGCWMNVDNCSFVRLLSKADCSPQGSLSKTAMSNVD